MKVFCPAAAAAAAAKPTVSYNFLCKSIGEEFR
jgi:hypothetical protein